MNANRDPRFLNIEGALNLRDFGGYITSDGGRIKQGLLFRCGALSGIPLHAYSEFAALDIGVICDLRHQDEVTMNPSPDSAPFDCRVHIPIEPGSSVHLKNSYDNPDMTVARRIEFMIEITREIARDHVSAYQQLFKELLETDRGFLLHCSAGKDRTGFGAAMIQLMLGVSTESVMEDYLLTNRAEELLERMKPAFESRYGHNVDLESLRVIAGVRAEYLTAAFEAIKDQHGGFEAYWSEAGMDEYARNELKRRLVEYD